MDHYYTEALIYYFLEVNDTTCYISMQRPGFNTAAVHVEFEVDEEAMRTGFCLSTLTFPCQLTLHQYSSPYSSIIRG
jgi:hypothetical protein